MLQRSNVLVGAFALAALFAGSVAMVRAQYCPNTSKDESYYCDETLYNPANFPFGQCTYSVDCAVDTFTLPRNDFWKIWDGVSTGNMAWTDDTLILCKTVYSCRWEPNLLDGVCIMDATAYNNYWAYYWRTQQC